ncbi:hypothetical protein [Celeribacter sp.]|uniref:hypothetical protein n=1 Tax=Celeribacter sp. TaxID=1890673 RepID=UPI003A8CB095
MINCDPSFLGRFQPYQFDTLEDAGAAAQGDAAKEMLARLNPQGIIGLTVGSSF